jgi:steroid 5-alpha reductase family enzyme
MLPVMFVNAAPAKAMDRISWVAAISAILGLIAETTADTQKDLYRSNPKNDGHWCDVGLWKYCRHPNCMYMLEALMLNFILNSFL